MGFIFGTGGSAIVAKTFGEGDREKVNQYFSLFVYVAAALGFLLAVLGIAFMRPIAAELLAAPLAGLFVSYDADLMALTVSGFRVFALSFLFMGYAIFGSGFFTALNDGVTSAIISFLRTLVFQVAAVLLLPMIWEIDGVWISIVIAEFMVVVFSGIFLIVKRKKYHY